MHPGAVCISVVFSGRSRFLRDRPLSLPDAQGGVRPVAPQKIPEREAAENQHRAEIQHVGERHARRHAVSESGGSPPSCRAGPGCR